MGQGLAIKFVIPKRETARAIGLVERVDRAIDAEMERDEGG